MKHRIETERTWDMETVRTYCIKNQYYTCGTGKEYDSMLHFVESHKPTNNALFRVAKDIFEHSDENACSVTFIMYEMEREVIYTFFTVYEIDENGNEFVAY